MVRLGSGLYGQGNYPEPTTLWSTLMAAIYFHQYSGMGATIRSFSNVPSRIHRDEPRLKLTASGGVSCWISVLTGPSLLELGRR